MKKRPGMTHYKKIHLIGAGLTFTMHLFISTIHTILVRSGWVYLYV